MISALLLLHAVAYEGPKCDQAKADQGIQQEMNICAANEYRAADKKLNMQWTVTMDHMKAMDASAEADGFDDDRKSNVETLLVAQRAWLKYRDAHCTNGGYVARGGSLEPLLVATCKTTLTEARTQQLKELAKEY